jgi:plastocyanin
MPNNDGVASRAARIAAGLAVAAGILLTLAACGGGGDGSSKQAVGPTQPRATATPRPAAAITIADNSFSPSSLTVEAGTNVVWTWTGSGQHSVVIAGANSGIKTSGTFEKVFESPGTSYPFQCGVHGAAMSGTIVVK